MTLYILYEKKNPSYQIFGHQEIDVLPFLSVNVYQTLSDLIANLFGARLT